MTITSKKAAEIATRHGLSLSDAAALSRLAEDENEADEIAAMFGDKGEKEDPIELSKQFGRL